MLYERTNLCGWCLALPHFSCFFAAPAHSPASPAPLRPGSNRETAGRGQGQGYGSLSERDGCRRQRRNHTLARGASVAAGLCLRHGWTAALAPAAGGGSDNGEGRRLLAPPCLHGAQKGVSEGQRFTCPPSAHHFSKPTPGRGLISRKRV